MRFQGFSFVDLALGVSLGFFIGRFSNLAFLGPYGVFASAGGAGVPSSIEVSSLIGASGGLFFFFLLFII